MDRPSQNANEQMGIGFYTESQGEICEVDIQKMKEFADRWAYVARKRRRWRTSSAAIGHLRHVALEQLKTEIGVSLDLLQQISKSGFVEIDYGSSSEALDAAARAPWELILSLATERFRSGSMLLVTRRVAQLQELDLGHSKVYHGDELPTHAVIVASAPGRLRRFVTFESERRLLNESLKNCQIDYLDSPNLKLIKESIRAWGATLVHFTGIGEIEGAQIAHSLQTEVVGTGTISERPGFYLPGVDEMESVVNPEEVASAVTASGSPLLVAFNCYDSGSYLSSYAVRGGARYSIGVQDEFDNPLLEKFFANFYVKWTAPGTDLSGSDAVAKLVLAFWKAVQVLQDQANYGYVVLWSREPLREHFKGCRDFLKRSAKSNSETPKIIDDTATVADARDIIQVNIKPFRELNYSMLHNHRSMFERFVLESPRKNVSGVQVEVALQVKGEDYLYKTSCDIKDYFHKLDRIQVSLTSDLLRSLRESVYTTLYVRVTYRNQIVAEITEKVRLLPINEWRDSKTDGVWLPSFVLPYDPAVVGIIDRSQNYLKALLDDSQASFRGYQGIQTARKDPDCGFVHAQVRAIWAALTYEFHLEYITPPPTFTDSSQRLRSPSDVITERRGTCIDLALLLAACLEHVEINPVVFLLVGHAFVGYFRSPNAHREFVSLFTSERLDPRSLNWRNEFQPQPWVLEADAYSHILELVRSGDLVPLETILLTRRAGVGDAYAQGRRNLSNRARFECVHDIGLARRNGVTPLPIGGGE